MQQSPSRPERGFVYIGNVSGSCLLLHRETCIGGVVFVKYL